MTISNTGPHQGQPIVTGGAPLATARGALVLTHGRGATAESILSLAPLLGADDFAWFAPQASGNTWYPFSFLSPIPQNEPGITSGIQVLHDLVAYIEKAGIPTERIVLAGFSQGACLTLEFGGATCTSVRCPGRLQRRPHRPRWHAARLRGFTRWHPGLPRLLRRRRAHSARRGYTRAPRCSPDSAAQWTSASIPECRTRSSTTRRRRCGQIVSGI